MKKTMFFLLIVLYLGVLGFIVYGIKKVPEIQQFGVAQLFYYEPDDEYRITVDNKDLTVYRIDRGELKTLHSGMKLSYIAISDTKRLFFSSDTEDPIEWAKQILKDKYGGHLTTTICIGLMLVLAIVMVKKDEEEKMFQESCDCENEKERK